MKNLAIIFQKIKTPFARLGKSPEYDWHFTLICFAVGLILMLVINSIIFLRLSSADESATVENVPTVKLNREDITKTLDEMKKRDSDAADISEVIVQDPSI
jgi:hypothetical protein